MNKFEKIKKEYYENDKDIDYLLNKYENIRDLRIILALVASGTSRIDYGFRMILGRFPEGEHDKIICDTINKYYKSLSQGTIVTLIKM